MFEARLEFCRSCVSPVRVRTKRQWTEYTELAGMFYLQAMASAMWFVPCGVVLDAQGLHSIKAYAFATTAVGAIVSPLIFGSMADRHVSPVRVLRWLSVAAAMAMTLVALALRLDWGAGIVLALIQLQALFSMPTSSIVTAIIFSRLRHAKTEFGPVRAMATLGWMSGCWVISALNADANERSAYSTAAMWLVLAGFTFVLPEVEPPKSLERLTLRQRLGWDALTLLKNHDHRGVFIAAALFYVPIAAFYPYTPTQLLGLGLTHPSAWMTLGQV